MITFSIGSIQGEILFFFPIKGVGCVVALRQCSVPEIFFIQLALDHISCYNPSRRGILDQVQGPYSSQHLSAILKMYQKLKCLSWKKLQ